MEEENTLPLSSSSTYVSHTPPEYPKIIEPPESKPESNWRLWLLDPAVAQSVRIIVTLDLAAVLYLAGYIQANLSSPAFSIIFWIVLTTVVIGAAAFF